MAMNPKAKLVLDRYQSLNTQRQTWEEHWQEVADYMMPRKADITKKRSKGDKRHELIFDGTAIHSLELSGLDNAATEILKNQGLKNEETWLNLINLYESHPKYLQYISILIKDVFQSEVAEFIKENSLILTEDFKTLFGLMWMRLSEVEKEILLKISQNDQPISRDEIKQFLSLSSMDIINGLQSLTRRFLVSKLENDQKLYTLSAVFKEYLRIYHH